MEVATSSHRPCHKMQSHCPLNATDKPKLTFSLQKQLGNEDTQKPGGSRIRKALLLASGVIALKFEDKCFFIFS